MKNKKEKSHYSTGKLLYRKSFTEWFMTQKLKVEVEGMEIEYDIYYHFGLNDMSAYTILFA